MDLEASFRTTKFCDLRSGLHRVLENGREGRGSLFGCSCSYFDVPFVQGGIRGCLSHFELQTHWISILKGWASMLDSRLHIELAVSWGFIVEKTGALIPDTFGGRTWMEAGVEVMVAWIYHFSSKRYMHCLDPCIQTHHIFSNTFVPSTPVSAPSLGLPRNSSSSTGLPWSSLILSNNLLSSISAPAT